MPDRTSGASLSERLFSESRHFSFFQLVRLLLREREGAVSPGGTGPAGRETVRFRPAASLGFAASDVESVARGEDPGAEIPTRFLVTVNFMGLYGPASPMPNHFTEEILWAGIDGQGVRDFLDLFHHRIISLFYRAWEKYRYPIQFEPGGADPVTARMLCLVGLGTRGMVEGAGVPAVPLLRTAGALGSRPRSAVGLEGFLRDHFPGIAVIVEACVEREAPIPATQRLRLGRSNARLGVDACLGERLRDRGGAFRIALGPLSGEDYRRFLPRGEDGDLARLVRLTRLFVLDPLTFDVALRLEAPAVPALRLAPEADLPLGQMSWLSPRGAAEGEACLSVRDIDPLARRAAAPSAAAAAPPRAGTRPTNRPESRPTVTRRL